MFPTKNFSQQAYRPRNGNQFQVQIPFQNTVGGFVAHPTQIGLNVQQQRMFRPQTPVIVSRMPNPVPVMPPNSASARMPNALQQGQPMRVYGSGKSGQKRHVDENDASTSYFKRARPDLFPQPSPTVQSPAASDKNMNDNFVVPVSQGTEKITVAIWNYFLSSRMEDDDLNRKLKLRAGLLSILNGAFPDCRLFIVGSSITGFATKTSDVDMCLMISENEVDQKRDATLILQAISRALSHCDFANSLHVIKAKVPILKFFDRVAGVECDLNINNLVGVRNSHLMRFYAYMDWRVRPLVLFIKKWARFHDINDASKMTISSYTLTLMLIHYLQVGVNPPVLPCLQQMKPDLFNPGKDVRRLSLKLDQEIDFTSNNRATLGELFLGFLNYYTNIFSFQDQVISVRLGKTLNFEDVSSGENAMQWKHLNVEEPFERSNTARSVFDKFVFMRVMRVFGVSYKTLETSRDIDQIFVRPF